MIRSATPIAVVVAPDGTIYFTDASTRFAPAQWGGTYEASVLDIMEQSATGRVLAYDPATGAHARRGAWPLVRQRHRAVVRRPHAVRERDRPLSHLEDRRPRERPRRAKRLAAGAGAARQPARLPGQPDARPRRPHLGRLVQAAQPGGRLARASGRSCARSCCACRESCLPLGRALRARLRHRRGWPRHRACRIRAAPIPRPPARPRPPIASTSTACTRTGSAGCRDEAHAQPQGLPSAPNAT